MSLHIVVCVKSTPDPEYYNKITIDAETGRMVREGVPTVLNPADLCALEKALCLKEAFGGKVSVITMAPPGATANLREALAMGADEAILLTDATFAGADTLATSYTLAKAIERLEGVDLILAGVESADGATGQVPSQLGEWLGLPHLWNVFSLEPQTERQYILKTKCERGYREWEGELPFVAGVSREIAKPRYVGAMGVLKASSKPLYTWAKTDIGNEETGYFGAEGAPTRAGAIKMPDMNRSGIRLEGTAEQVAEAIFDKMRGSGVFV